VAQTIIPPFNSSLFGCAPDSAAWTSICRGERDGRAVTWWKTGHDFSLHATPDQEVSLGDLHARPIILAFYPADWSPVCGDQMGFSDESFPEFEKHGAVLLVIRLTARGA
jgi:AhpC/TSA family